jgi:hypothetical protein
MKNTGKKFAKFEVRTRARRDVLTVTEAAYRLNVRSILSIVEQQVSMKHGISALGY